MLYLFVGIDFEISEYQFSSRLRKFILIILVGAAIATSVVIFQQSQQPSIDTINNGVRCSLFIYQSMPVFLFGIQSVSGFNLYLNFILTLITMVLFALIYFKVLLKLDIF